METSLSTPDETPGKIVPEGLVKMAIRQGLKRAIEEGQTEFVVSKGGLPATISANKMLELIEGD